MVGMEEGELSKDRFLDQHELPHLLPPVHKAGVIRAASLACDKIGEHIHYLAQHYIYTLRSAA